MLQNEKKRKKKMKKKRHQKKAVKMKDDGNMASGPLASQATFVVSNSESSA